MKTVNDMWKYARDNNLKLLSDFNADFWQDYISNYARYDKLFRRLYYSFKYFMQECDSDLEDISDITTEFIDDVYNHLMANKKKYEELYRIHVIADEDYSITDNYHIREVLDKDTTENNNNTYGNRSDSSNVGSQTVTNQNDVSPYNSSGYYANDKDTNIIGARSDTFTKGEQSDALAKTGTENYTLTRNGNIGVQTGTEMLDKHNRYWDKYKFYEYIFACICADLLLV
jgi:hypothetical protein